MQHDWEVDELGRDNHARVARVNTALKAPQLFSGMHHITNGENSNCAYIGWADTRNMPLSFQAAGITTWFDEDDMQAPLRLPDVASK